MKRKSKTAYYNEGWNAYKDGKDFRDCPYDIVNNPTGTTYWRHGWLAARREQ